MVDVDRAARVGDDVRVAGNGDAQVALLGHPDRHLGVITWVLFFGLFCAGQQLVEETASMARAGALGAALLGLYSPWELLFGPPIAIATTTRRLLGPLGSAAFLGAACCLLGPVALGVAFDRSQDRRWRWLGGGRRGVGDDRRGGLGTRAAWVGATVAAVMVVVVVRPTMRNVLLCGAGLVVALAMVAPRLNDVSSRRDGGSSRLDEWRVAAQVIGRHPILGVGPEGYRIAVAEGIDDSYERAYRRDRVLPDRAHSGPLDVTLAGGIGAGLLYVGLFGFVGWRSWKLIRSRRPIAVGIGAAFIAYGVQQLLLFPVPELDPIWWVVRRIDRGVDVRTSGRGRPTYSGSGSRRSGSGDHARRRRARRCGRSADTHGAALDGSRRRRRCRDQSCVPTARQHPLSVDRGRDIPEQRHARRHRSRPSPRPVERRSGRRRIRSPTTSWQQQCRLGHP